VECLIGREGMGFVRVEDEEGWLYIRSISFWASSSMIEVADPEATGATDLVVSISSKVGMKDGTYAGGFRGFLRFVDALNVLCGDSSGRDEEASRSSNKLT
jgi:hypothetical protein